MIDVYKFVVWYCFNFVFVYCWMLLINSTCCLPLIVLLFIVFVYYLLFVCRVFVILSIYWSLLEKTLQKNSIWLNTLMLL